MIGQVRSRAIIIAAGSGALRRAQNGAEVAWIGNAVDDQNRVGAGRDNLIQRRVAVFADDRRDALMARVAPGDSRQRRVVGRNDLAAARAHSLDLFAKSCLVAVPDVEHSHRRGRCREQLLHRLDAEHHLRFSGLI